MVGEKTEDYAVAAAREWLKARYGYHAHHCSCCEADIAQLAAIIRKHVDAELTCKDTGYCDCRLLHPE